MGALACSPWLLLMLYIASPAPLCRRDPYGFYLTGDLHLSDGRLKPVPLVCHQLWELFLRRVRRAGRIVLGVWHRQTDFTDCGTSHSTSAIVTGLHVACVCKPFWV